MKAAKLAAVFTLAVSLAACQTTGGKQGTGTLLGAGLGALAGSQIGSGSGQLAAVALGTLGGAYLGGEIGASLDRADQAFAQQTAFSSLDRTPTGTVSQWQNPDSGNSGTFTPTRTFKSRAGQDCRDYETTVNINGRTEIAKGTACRQPDGSWQIVQ